MELKQSLETLIPVLMESRNVAHVEHLKTDSYAKHVALQQYYEGIIPLIDELAETFQGKYVAKLDLKLEGSIRDCEDLLRNINAVIDKIKTDDSTIQNILDTISGLVSSTIYKLKFLN